MEAKLAMDMDIDMEMDMEMDMDMDHLLSLAEDAAKMYVQSPMALKSISISIF